MMEIENTELINKFVENSLSPDELELFNTKYKEEPEFAELANTFFDISIGIKAAEKFGKIVAKKNKPARIYTNYTWFIAKAASVALIIWIAGYAFYLFRENKMLSKNNIALSDKLDKTECHINTLSEKKETVLSGGEKKKQTLPVDTQNDKKYLSNMMALTKVVEAINMENEMTVTRNMNISISVFPLQSKIINVNNAFIHLNKVQAKMPLNFLLIELPKSDTIYRIEGYVKEEISLQKTKIAEGKKYRWVLRYNNKEVGSGKFTALSAKEKSKMKEFTYISADDYIEAFIYYYNNGYYFDAQAILGKAIKAYPYSELFGYLQKLLLNVQ